MAHLKINKGIQVEGRNGMFDLREVGVTVWRATETDPEVAIVGLRSRRKGQSSPSKIVGHPIRVIALLEKTLAELKTEWAKIEAAQRGGAAND